jgi:hypothetical protein
MIGSHAVTIVLRPVGAIGFSIDKYPKKLSLNLLCFTICMLGTLIYWAYNSCLIGFLAYKVEQDPFKDFKDLKNLPNFRLLIWDGSSQVQNIVSILSQEDFNIIWEQNIKENIIHTLTRKEDIDILFMSAFDKDSVGFFTPRNYFLKMISTYLKTL